MFDTMVGLTTSVFIILVLASQFGLSTQACAECTCCKGVNSCDSDRNCTNGCNDGYYGSKCTEGCLENCKSCENDYECTECKPGYYANKCNLQCGKGCINNTCSHVSGECQCKSAGFEEGKCDACSGTMYGDECNNTCPSECGSCTSGTQCGWCINTIRYGSYCQYKCSHGCIGGKCYKGNGHCIAKVCKYGFSGVKCDKCSPGLYGTYCDLNCTENCISCLSATNCTVCRSGFYGETCTSTCPSGCNGNCSLIDGKCFDCKPGFVGEFCNHTCKDGTNGGNCSKSCRNIDQHCQVCNTNKSGSYQDCTHCDSKYYLTVPFGYNHSICTVCPSDCLNMVCEKAGFCTYGCVRGKWGDKCNTSCATNCVACDQDNGTCLECNHNLFSHNCSKVCSTNCNNTVNSRVCTRDAGKCLHGCKSITNYGEYCEKNCSETCNNERCNWKTGYCSEGCAINYYGTFCNNTCAATCQSNESNRICDDVRGNCLFGCKDGFYGEKCDNKCSSQCVNATCNQETAECLHGCVDGYEEQECFLAIKSAESEEKTSIVIIAAPAGAGVIVIVLLVMLVICITKRNLRQKLSSNTKCEENDYVLDMKEIPKQIDKDEPGAIYAKPFKPKQEAGGDAGKEYDTAYDGDKKIPGIDNGYTAVNIGTSANEQNKSFEVCDIAYDNKSYKPLGGNDNYAVVNKGNSTVKENECFEEVYDTTHDNKKNKQPLSSNNDYAVLSVRSDNIKGFSKSNLAQQDDVYDSAEGGKHITLHRPNNDYAVFKCNNGDKHENDKANTLYDTKNDMKLRPVNNDYDFCELEND